MTANHPSNSRRTFGQPVAAAHVSLLCCLLGCQRTDPQAATPHTASNPNPVSAPHEAAPSSESGVTPQPTASAVSTAPSAPGLGSVRQTSQPGVKITGCLAENAAKDAPTRSGPTRSAPANTSQTNTSQANTTTANAPSDPWRVTALGSTVLVTHTLEHACCLEATVTASVNDHQIVVEEHLTGEPCRCVCESTIQTRVSAPAGEYEVQSYTIANGIKHLAHSGQVTVGGAFRPSKR